MQDSLWELVDAACSRHPDAVALLAPGHRPLSYRQLAEQVEYVGRAIRAAGIQRNDRVAVVLPDGPDIAAAFLGVAACTACAPLNPQLRRDDFLFYLTDLRAKAVILPAERECPAREAAERLGLLVMNLVASTDREAGRFHLAHSAEQPSAPVDWGTADDVALVLHTSGTTSRPKLVPLSQRNLGASAGNIGRVLELTCSDLCLNVMPLFHIHGLMGVLLSSVAAGAAVVCSPGYQETAFADWLAEFEPTWYSAVPTIHQSILRRIGLQGPPPGARRLRFIRSSSSALPPAVMKDLERTFGVPVIESYGMTEASHQMASNPLPPAVRKPGSVGLPAGPEMAVMDDKGQLLGHGETGEIVIRGPSVTHGYENNPGANEGAFTNGWFHTGDQGFMDAEGYVFLSGRIKEIINRGGEKISPREIDEVLLEHPAVAQAVAFAVPHPTLGEDVAAAVVLRQDAHASPGEIRELAFQRLAAFKIPSRIAIVDEIPKGPTGKIQRVGLAEKLARELTTEFVGPRTEIESLLLDIWQEILGETRVGMLHNFFAAGGDSLRGTRVMSRVNELFELQLPVTFIFRYPTLEQFSVQISRIADPDRLRTIAQAFKEVVAMSDEEARHWLDVESGSP